MSKKGMTLLTKLVFLSLFSISFTQNPVPVSDISIDDFQGAWFMIRDYDTRRSSSTPVSCWSWDIAVTNEGFALFQEFVEDGEISSYVDQFILGTLDSIWITDEGSTLNVLYLDAFNQEYAVLGWSNKQSCILVARNTSVSDAVLNSTLYLCKSEGYLMTPGNTSYVNYDNCTLSTQISK